MIIEKAVMHNNIGGHDPTTISLQMCKPSLIDHCLN